MIIVIIIIIIIHIIYIYIYRERERERERSNFSVRAVRAQMYRFELFDIILLLKLDKQLPVERFEVAVSQSTVPSPLLFLGFSPKLNLISGVTSQKRRYTDVCVSLSLSLSLSLYIYIYIYIYMCIYIYIYIMHTYIYIYIYTFIIILAAKNSKYIQNISRG